MLTYRIGNYTVSRDILEVFFCKQFSAQDLYEILNITCSQLQSTNSSSIPMNADTDTQSGAWTMSRKLLVVATAIIFVVGIVCNLGLLSFLYKHKRLLKTSWCYVFNLAITDVLVLLNMLSFIVVFIVPEIVLPERLKIFLFPSLDMFVSSASMLSVAGIAFDKVFKFCFPQSTYHGRRLKTMKIILFLIWFYCFILFGLSIARVFKPTGDRYNMFVFWLATVVAFMGSILVTTVCCVVVVSMYIKQKLFFNKATSTLSIESLIRKHQQKMETKKVNKRRSVVKSLLMIMACLPFLMGWSFYLSIQTYEVVNKTYLGSPALNMAMLLVPWIISAINPLIFIFAQKSLRRGVAKILMRRKNVNNIFNNTTDNKSLTAV